MHGSCATEFAMRQQLAGLAPSAHAAVGPACRPPRLLVRWPTRQLAIAWTAWRRLAVAFRQAVPTACRAMPCCAAPIVCRPAPHHRRRRRAPRPHEANTDHPCCSCARMRSTRCFITGCPCDVRLRSALPLAARRLASAASRAARSSRACCAASRAAASAACGAGGGGLGGEVSGHALHGCTVHGAPACGRHRSIASWQDGRRRGPRQASLKLQQQEPGHAPPSQPALAPCGRAAGRRCRRQPAVQLAAGFGGGPARTTAAGPTLRSCTSAAMRCRRDCGLCGAPASPQRPRPPCRPRPRPPPRPPPPRPPCCCRHCCCPSSCCRCSCPSCSEDSTSCRRCGAAAAVAAAAAAPRCAGLLGPPTAPWTACSSSSLSCGA